MSDAMPPAPHEGQVGVRLVKETSLYTLGIAVTRFANLLLLPLYLNVLSKEAYGALGVLEQLGQLLVMLTMAGGLEALLKIGTDLRDTPEAQLRMVSTMTTWMLVAGAVVAVLCALLWPWVGESLGGIALWPSAAYTLSGVAGSAAFQSLSAHLQMQGKAERHTLYAALRTLLNVVIAVPLLLFTDMGVNALLLAGSASFWTGAALLLFQLPRGMVFVVDPAILRRVLSYGVPLLPDMVAALVFQATDKFMLAGSDAQGLEAVGVYSVGSRIASGVMMLGLGLQRAWLPYFFKEAALDDAASWGRVRRLSFWSMAGMAAAVAALGLLAPELVELIAPAGYSAAALVTAVLCISALLRTGAQVSGSVVLSVATGSYRIWIASGSAALINIALNLVFIPKYGALGAAWATTAAMALNMLFTVGISHLVRPVPFRYGAIVVLIGVVLAVVVGAADAPLLARLALCAAVPVVALALDARFARDQLRSLVANRRRRP